MNVRSQLSSTRRPKWIHITIGVSLIVLAVALTVFWQILAGSDWVTREAGTVRWGIYFLGTLLFLLLIGGLTLMVLLLIREGRVNERQSKFVRAATHGLKTPLASLNRYLE